MREIEFDIWCLCLRERDNCSVCVYKRDWTLAGGTSPVPDVSQHERDLPCEMVTAGQRGILAPHLSSCPIRMYPCLLLNCSHQYKLYKAYIK